MGRRRIIVADDHLIVLAGLTSLLQSDKRYSVVATASNGAEALAKILEARPGIAVLDINMPELTGVEVLEKLADRVPETKIVLLTASVQDAQIASAVRAGVCGLLLKQSAADELLLCLDEVWSGSKWLPPELVEPALARVTAREGEVAILDAALTAREREIVDLVAKGLPNKVISRQTGISEGTVKIHLHNIYGKLGVSNRTELATMASRTEGGG